MLGGLLALLSALTFAFNNAGIRRGVLTGTVAQAMAFSLPIGVLVLFLTLVATGMLSALTSFSTQSLVLLSIAGVIHFAWGRYCDYRAVKAIGVNLVGPVQQLSLVLTLILAVLVLGEELTPLRILGIALVALGPWLTQERKDHASMAFLGNASQSKSRLAEGYVFALLSIVGFGTSPILVRMALEQSSVDAGIAGTLISYIAATIPVMLILLLPGQWRHVRNTDPQSGKWFVASGVAVCVSQMFRYMALSVAPVTVVTPIQRLSIIFRVYFSWLLNREYEAIGGRVVIGTAVSLLGAIALSISTEFVSSWLPSSFAAIAAWRWP